MNARLIRRFSPVILFALCVGLAGCKGKSNLPAAGSVDADKYLYDHGAAALKRKHWLEAREYFKKLVDTYPQSQYRQEAKLGIGDSYVGENSIESNILAVNEFREFLSFFPGNARTDYAQYRIALSNEHQMLGPERDPTPAQDALDACNLFLKNYPTSQYRSEVEKLKREAQNQLSGHDFKVGIYYFHVGWFPGALERFKALLEKDPEYPERDAVYYYLAEMYHRTKQNNAALPFYDRVVKEFEKSDYTERAKKRIAEITTADAQPATPPPAVKR
jgi:outer membrane protein assembly factor BamD